MAQVSCWPLVAEDQVQSQASPENVVGCTMAQVVSSLVAGLWLQMPQLNPRHVQVALSQALPPVPWFSPVNIMPTRTPRWHSRYSKSLLAVQYGNQIVVRVRFSMPFRPAPSPNHLQYNGHWVFPVGKVVRAWCWPPIPSNARLWMG